MEENTETVKEPQYLIQDLCDQIKQLTKKKLNKIQSEINKSTNLSTGVIRKYEGEISKNKPELFLIGCVEVAEKNNLSSNIINQFIAKYIQSFKNNKQYTIDLKAVFKDNNELQYERKEDEENKHIICPQVLKDKLDTFLQRSPKRFLYLAGTYNSGITISVIKYFEEKNDGESPQIFDFYRHSIEEIKRSMALKAALMQDECVIIHVGLQTFPFSRMKFPQTRKNRICHYMICIIMNSTRKYDFEIQTEEFRKKVMFALYNRIIEQGNAENDIQIDLKNCHVGPLVNAGQVLFGDGNENNFGYPDEEKE